jgi:hypothetical protein
MSNIINAVERYGVGLEPTHFRGKSGNDSVKSLSTMETRKTASGINTCHINASRGLTHLGNLRVHRYLETTRDLCTVQKSLWVPKPFGVKHDNQQTKLERKAMSREKTNKLSGDQLTDWWDAWQEVTTIPVLARWFSTSTRTVRQWLTMGLESFWCIKDVPTCRKYREPIREAMRWGINPLGATVWHMDRLSQGKIHAPELVTRLLGNESLFKVAWDLQHEGKRKKPPLPAMTWQSVMDHDLYFLLPAVHWFANTEHWGGPYVMMACESPEDFMVWAREQRAS